MLSYVELRLVEDKRYGPPSTRDKILPPDPRVTSNGVSLLGSVWKSEEVTGRERTHPLSVGKRLEEMSIGGVPRTVRRTLE